MKLFSGRNGVFLCAFASVAATALSNVWSVFLNPLAEAYSCPGETVRLVYSCYALGQAVFGIISALLLKKLGFSKLIAIGSLSMTAGLFGLWLTKTVFGLFFSFSFLFGMGAGLVYTISVANTLKWFPESRGKISGLLLAASSIMGIVMAPLVNLLCERFGVKTCCMILGIGFLAVFAATVPMAKPAPETANGKNEASAISGRDLAWREMLRTRKFYTAFFMFVFANIGSITMITSASPIAQSYTGMTAGKAAVWVSVMAGCNLFGRLFFGFISDKIGRIKTFMIICFVTFAALILVSASSAQTVFILAMCLIGMAGGAILACLPALCGDLFGAKYSSMNYSLLFFGFAASSYTAPFIMSFFGSDYSAAFIACALMCLAGFALCIILGKMMSEKNKFTAPGASK